MTNDMFCNFLFSLSRMESGKEEIHTRSDVLSITIIKGKENYGSADINFENPNFDLGLNEYL